MRQSQGRSRMPAAVRNDEVAGNGIGSAESIAARYETLVRVSEALRAYRDLDTLLRGLARELHPVVQFSFLGLAIHDEQTGAIDRYVLERSGEPVRPPDLPAGETISSWIVRHQEPLVIRDIEREAR